MRNPFKGDQIAKLKDMIAKTESAIEKTTVRRGVSEKLLGEYKEKRRAALRDDPENLPAELRHSIDIAERDLIATDEEIADLQESLTELQEGLVAAEEKKAGEKSAATLEAVAGKVDAAAADLEVAMKAVAKAAKALEAALPPTLAVYEQTGHERPKDREERGPATPREIVSATVAEALIAVVPEVFDQPRAFYGYEQVLRRFFHLSADRPAYRTDESPQSGDGLPARTAAQKLISDRLRARAAAIRAGEASSMIEDRKPWAPPPVAAEEDSISEVSVFVKTSFSYVSNDFGHVELVGNRWTRWVPAPVAEVAIKKGYALSMDTPAGQNAFAAEREYRQNSNVSISSRLTHEDCVPLGDVMKLIPPAEAAE